MKLIWAQDKTGCIGVRNTLPWQLPEDLQHFKKTTMGSPIIMGRNTFESLPRLLPGRAHLVITSRPVSLPEGAIAHSSLEAAVAAAPDAWIIGGAQIYRAALPAATTVVRTVIHAEFHGDAFAPALPVHLQLLQRSDIHCSKAGLRYHFERWES